jgi:formyltetrahydrofolate deformylase
VATAILLAHGPVRPRLAAALTDFVYQRGGKIVYHEQHVDHESSLYFTRLEWDLAGFRVPLDDLDREFGDAVGRDAGLRWRIHLTGRPQRMAVFVSRLPHCLYDIAARCQSGEWPAQVALVVGNHADLEPVARTFGLDFLHTPVSAAAKGAAEERQLAALRERGVDLVVLARYMQVVSAGFIAEYSDAIINIHHAFLPAFPGAKPYHAARKRGVKIVGATSHYVTADLDEGPIIDQDVIRVGHQHTTEDLVRMGRDLERIVLARAVWMHLQRKVIVHEGRTVIFG